MIGFRQVQQMYALILQYGTESPSRAAEQEAGMSAYSLRDLLMQRTPQVQHRPGWEVITLLVTVKAYPVIAQKSGESVCVAGVRLDTPSPAWVRLFPVGFRALPREKQFQKYRVIRLRARRRGGSDRRPETYTPDLGSLVVGPRVDTDDGTWQRRSELLGDLLGGTTTCALSAKARSIGQEAPSLGLVKPRAVRLSVSENPDYRPGGEVVVDVDLFGEEREVLEKTPFIATYEYSCADEESCGGHRQSIIDWESGQLARRNLERMQPEQAREAHKRRFLDDIFSDERDTYLFVGNQHQHPGSFLVLGLFYPRGNPQPTLPLGGI